MNPTTAPKTAPRRAPLPPGQWIPCPVCATLHDRGRRGARENCSRRCATIITSALNTGQRRPRQQPTPIRRRTNNPWLSA